MYFGHSPQLHVDYSSCDFLKDALLFVKRKPEKRTRTGTPAEYAGSTDAPRFKI
jgi:hypothetical protein